MKIFSCKVTGFHPGTLLNKVSDIEAFFGTTQPFEKQLFLWAVAKIQVFILQLVFRQAKIKNVKLAESFLHISKVRLS